MPNPIEGRIKKLIKLAQGSSNPNEQKSAMAMARRLAEKHNIQISEIKEEPKRMQIDGIENVERMMKMFGMKAGRSRE